MKQFKLRDFDEESQKMGRGNETFSEAEFNYWFLKHCFIIYFFFGERSGQHLYLRMANPLSSGDL